MHTSLYKNNNSTTRLWAHQHHFSFLSKYLNHNYGVLIFDNLKFTFLRHVNETRMGLATRIITELPVNAFRL